MFNMAGLLDDADEFKIFFILIIIFSLSLLRSTVSLILFSLLHFHVSYFMDLFECFHCRFKIYFWLILWYLYFDGFGRVFWFLFVSNFAIFGIVIK